MARLLQLNDTQEGVLNIVFKVADEQGLLLLDFKDLQAMLQWTAENAGTLTTKYGNVSQAVDRHHPARAADARAAGRRALLRRAGARPQGHDPHRRERARRRQRAGRRQADADAPGSTRTFLLWLLSELFEVHARGRRPREAQVRVLLRRGAPAVRRRAQGAARQDRAGGAADPLQGRRRLFRHARTRSTCPTRCWASSATACSTRCAPSRPRTRRR